MTKKTYMTYEEKGVLHRISPRAFRATSCGVITAIMVPKLTIAQVRRHPKRCYQCWRNTKAKPPKQKRDKMIVRLLPEERRFGVKDYIIVQYANGELKSVNQNDAQWKYYRRLAIQQRAIKRHA